MGAQTGNCYDGMGSTAGWKKHFLLHKIGMQMWHNVPLTFLVVQGVGGAPRGLAVVERLSVALLRVKEVLQCSIRIVHSPAAGSSAQRRGHRPAAIGT